MLNLDHIDLFILILFPRIKKERFATFTMTSGAVLL